MPLYEYECGACGHRLEIIQKFSDGPPDACPKCGKGPLQRQQSSPAFQFKGTGWDVTDYAAKGKGSDKGGANGSTGDAAKGDASKGDDKPAKSESSGEGAGSGSKKSDAPASTPSTKD